MEDLRSLVKKTDVDGFFTHSSPVGCYIGTMLMMVSLVHISGGINLNQSQHMAQSNASMINTLMAGCGGAVGTLLFRHLLYTFIIKRDAETLDQLTFDQPWKRANFIALRKKTFFFNIYTAVDPYMVQRGLIAGMVSVSLNPSSFYPITALINGLIAGGIYVASLKIFQVMKLDDTNHAGSVHGVMGLYALLSICFFHKEEGFFFNDIYLSYIETESEQIAPIILVLGSNSLASFAVVFLSTFTCFIVIRVLMHPIRRVTKVQEIIGQDMYHLFAIGDRILKNHIYGIINAFYPEADGEYALKKAKLIQGGGLQSQSSQSKKDGSKLLTLA